jgi:alpha,alpha-trehalase
MTYERIENYGMIGDCHGCALISHRGRIDWMTLGRFDSSPHFWRILDEDQGSSLDIALNDEYQWRRSYLKDSNILVTEAFNNKHLIRITDFMPVGRKVDSKMHDYTQLETMHGVVRILEIEGEVAKINIHHRNHSWPTSKNKSFLYAGHDDLKLIPQEEMEFHLSENQPLYLAVTGTPLDYLNIKQLQSLKQITIAFWEEWITYSQYQGPYQELLKRSLLTLKMLIHAPSGAIMAAATTSLPEYLGGERNWDYRFCWLRDATFTLYSLGYTGYSGEADSFSKYLAMVTCKNEGPLNVLYDVDGNYDLAESTFPSLHGYKGSFPVRAGNSATSQLQLDTFGEFMDWAYLHQQLGGTLDKAVLNKIEATANFVIENWHKKDRGIWEIRGVEEDFTYSKIMCWVALDRAGSLLGDHHRYQQEKEKIKHYISTYCVEDERLKRSEQCKNLDASLLLSKIVGYPVDDQIYANTLEAIMHELKTSNGPFIKRYNSDDGLPGEEGEFLICSFWAVNAYLFIGKENIARELFEKLLTCFNDLGLMSEEYDSQHEQFLGNYPQALTHLALIETASYFDLFQRGGKEALTGCHGDRVKKLHKTLHGPRAVWNFVMKTGNIIKVFPSRASILEWSSR